MFFPFSVKKEPSSNITGLMTLDKAGHKTINLKKRDGNAENNDDNTNGNSEINNSSSSSSISNRKGDKKTKCFICNNYIDFNNELIMSLLRLSEGYNSNSDIIYCYDCLENLGNDVYDNYKKKFMNAFVDIR